MEIANQILQDILKLPGAKYLALLVQNGPKDDSGTAFYNWLFTGQYTPEALSKDVMKRYLEDKSIVDRLVCDVYYSSKQEVLNDLMVDWLRERPNFTNIFRKAEVIESLFNIIGHSDVRMDPKLDYLNYLSEWIRTGDPSDEVDDISPMLNNVACLFLRDPKLMEEEIERELSMDQSKIIGYLEDVIDIKENLNDNEQLKYLLSELSENPGKIDKEDLQVIFDYFNPAPVAPTVPNLSP